MQELLVNYKLLLGAYISIVDISRGFFVGLHDFITVALSKVSRQILLLQSSFLLQQDASIEQ